MTCCLPPIKIISCSSMLLSSYFQGDDLDIPKAWKWFRKWQEIYFRKHLELWVKLCSGHGPSFSSHHQKSCWSGIQRIWAGNRVFSLWAIWIVGLVAKFKTNSQSKAAQIIVLAFLWKECCRSTSRWWRLFQNFTSLEPSAILLFQTGQLPLFTPPSQQGLSRTDWQGFWASAGKHCHFEDPQMGCSVARYGLCLLLRYLDLSVEGHALFRSFGSFFHPTVRAVSHSSSWNPFVNMSLGQTTKDLTS